MMTVSIINNCERKQISICDALNMFDSAHILLTSAYNMRISMIDLKYLIHPYYIINRPMYKELNGLPLYINANSGLIPGEGSVLDCFIARSLQKYSTDKGHNVAAYELSEKLIPEELGEISNITPAVIFDMCNNGGIILYYKQNNPNTEIPVPQECERYYSEFDFSDIICLVNEIDRLVNLKDMNEAILSAVRFQRSYARWLQNSVGLTKDMSHLKSLDTIRCLGNLNTAIAEKVNCLWNRRSYLYE